MSACRLISVIALFAVSSNPLLAEDGPPAWQWKELEGPLGRHIDAVAFSPDGSLVAAGSGDTICVWTTDTGKPVTRMKLPQTQIYHRLAFSSDGKVLISDCRDETLIRFWDAKTGKQLKEVAHPRSTNKMPENYYSYTFKAFGPAGDIEIGDLRATTDHYELSVIDLATMKARSAIKLDLSIHDHWAEAAVAPDGKSFAYNGPAAQLRLFSTATGELVKELRPPDKGNALRSGYRSSVRFSPDGKYLMAQEHTGRIETFDIYRFVVWGVADGRRYWAVEKQGGWISAGNRYLLRDDKFVLDLLTDRTVPIRNGATDGRQLAGMSADGKTLAFVGPGSGAAIGNVRPLSVYLTPAPVLPQPDDFAGRDVPPIDLDFTWSGVVADNLFRRERSARILAAHPGQALGMAREKLKPVPAADRERVAGLIVKLDDDSADVRDKATADLQQVAHRFEPMLAIALKDAKPGEVKNRLTAVTKKMTETTPPTELVAELRGIEFLAALGTLEARKLAAAIAAGAPGTRVTDAAAAVQKRLDAPK